jgi:hypothetical protein
MLPDRLQEFDDEASIWRSVDGLSLQTPLHAKDGYRGFPRLPASAVAWLNDSAAAAPWHGHAPGHPPSSPKPQLRFANGLPCSSAAAQ